MCLWTTAPRVGNQYGIAGEYADLEKLFVDCLFIQAPTIATYIEQLKTITRGFYIPNPNEIKHALRSINELGPTANDVDGLRGVTCLPLKLGNGIKVIESPGTEFFIVDRLEYAAAFEGKVNVLDFSLEEVRQFQRLLISLGLADRYLSSAVEEVTSVLQPAARRTSSLTREFRRKAKALLRYVTIFRY